MVTSTMASGKITEWMVKVHCVFANGARFKGTFREGKRDGKSVEIREDGSRIDCTYREGMKHGKY